MRLSLACCLCLTVAILTLTGCGRISPAPQPTGPAPAPACNLSDIAPSRPDTPARPAGAPRPWRQRLALFEETTIIHEPLYFRGRYDDCSDYPVSFSLWNKLDRRATVYAPIETLADLVLLPLQLYQNPPCQSDASYSIYPFVAPTDQPSPLTATAECGR